MLKQIISATTCGTVILLTAITPAKAESINIQFTGVVPEQVSVDISAPQVSEVKVATTAQVNMQIPEKISNSRTVRINSTQPISVLITSNQGIGYELTNPSTEKFDLKVPIGNSNQPTKTNPELLTITIVPQ